MASVDSADVTRADCAARQAFEQSGQGVCGRELGAVDAGEALLGAQGNGCQTCAGQRLASGKNLTPELRLPFADHDRRHMGQRGQVARRAHRALLGDQGGDTTREHLFQ